MKRLALLTLVGFLFVSTTLAFPDNISKEHPKYTQIENNLIKGLQSGNHGLIFSCAYMLGEMQSERAVNELTKILRTSDKEDLQIIAALSLTKIGTERSIYVVKQEVRFADNEKVARLCDKFYKAFIQNKYFKDDASKQIQYASLM